ncbi:MAG TPA: PilC/PilY family type IV pilus protein [Pseudomonas sp.]|nr:PilC/PilY family type IV pilus protein [Pseudomonas sp.]
MKRNLINGLLGMLLAGVNSLAMAEDIDLFVDNPAGAPPNVLLVLDNGANFSSAADFASCPDEADWPATMLNTVGGIEQCALYKVVNSLKEGGVNLGVMVFNANNMSDDCPGGTGGCLVYPLRLLDADGKTAIQTWIKGWKTSGSTTADSLNIKSNSNKNGSAMQEAWAMFKGKKGLSGRTYTAPSAACKNYVIFIGNSFSSSGSPGEGGSTGQINPEKALFGTISGGDTLMNASPAATTAQKTTISGPIPVSCGGGGSFTFGGNHLTQGYYADEWARYMNGDGITTYSVGMLGASCQQNYEALLKSMGSTDVGGGKYYPTTDFEELREALQGALSEIQSVNSVFASVSLPVSVNTQGTYLNQVFVGMFRPDADAAPRWYGNLKQYKLGYLDGTLKLLDADDNSAISASGSGFVAECARSYWTPLKSASSSNLYWADIEDANCGTYSAASETPDGNMVEKGGQSYELRSLTPANRNVLTCDASCDSSLAAFNVSNTAITSAALGVTDAERDELINWARGLNSDAESIADSLNADGSVNDKTTAAAEVLMRPSAHGDVVHSRPVAINYAATANAPAQVVVFYGGNDGMLRAVNGNRESAADGISFSGKGPGEEFWSFVAPESYGLFERLKANTPLIKFANVVDGEPKEYGFDGPMTAYKTSSQAWLYATMRRGGRMLYAFDVTDPSSPSLKWRAGCSSQDDDLSCTDSDFTGIGQTWAVPVVIKSAGYTDDTGNTKPMLIMGAGYDRCEDDDPDSCDGDSKGHAIYVLDAASGDVLNTFDSSDVVGAMGGVIGDVTVVKDGNGLAEYAYAADLSGNVYRISGGVNAPIGSVAPGAWEITKIASLGGSGSNARKFFFGPDVVVDNGVNYILLGSGDREKPTLDFPEAADVQNDFFMIKDQPTNASWLSSENETCGADLFCMDSLYPILLADDTPSQSLLDAKKGWYLQLDSSEQVVTSALTIFGTVYFSTHQPDTGLSEGSCSAQLGETRAYAISYKNAEGKDGERYTDLVGDGLPPSPVAGLVTLDNGDTVPFCIGCSGASPLEGSEPEAPPAASQPKARVFWNIEE